MCTYPFALLFELLFCHCCVSVFLVLHWFSLFYVRICQLLNCYLAIKMFSALKIHLQIMISSVVKPSNGRKRSKPRCRSAPSLLSIDKIVPKRQMQWTEEVMEAFTSDVRSSKYSMLHAAKIYGIPKSTLHDRISGKVIHGQKAGPKRYFTLAEESDMADFLVDVAKAGYGKTIMQV